MPRVRAFAYDLVAARGPVSGRVALLLRSTEGKPLCALAFFERNLPFCSLACQGQGGGGERGARNRLSPGGLLVQMGCSPGEEYDIAGLGIKREKAVAKKLRTLAFKKTSFS
jgi:hypothetical protein